MAKLICFITLTLYFILPCFAEESITITTYYPSPRGSYRELRNKRQAIGDNYIQSSEYCWEGAPACANDIDDNADLVVEGNVGIGTLQPSAKLDIEGQVRIRQGSPDAGRVLTAVDATGLAEWSQNNSTFFKATATLGSLIDNTENKLEFNHSLGSTPKQVRWVLVCNSDACFLTGNNWLKGKEVDVSVVMCGYQWNCLVQYADDQKVGIYSPEDTLYLNPVGETKGWINTEKQNWKLKVYAGN